MLNQAAEILHSKENENTKKDTLKSHGKVEKSVSAESPSGKKEKIKSPSPSKRFLPSTPKKADKEVSRSSEDISTRKKEEKVAEKSETLTVKYKYNSLPRKSKGRQLSSSTFYVHDEESQKHRPASPRNASPKVKRKELARNGSNSSYDNNHDKQTHVALYKFYARHKDEVTFVDGDPIQVLKMFDDLWYEGINLSTGKQGLFPCRYVADIMSHEIPSSKTKLHHLFHILLYTRNY